MTMDPTGGEPHDAPRAGATARALDWSRERTRRATQWSLAARSTHPSVDVGFRLADRDKRVAAGVLAGGVAYRLFFWIISVSVLSTGGLGVMQREWVEETLRQAGLTPAAVEAVQDVTRRSEPARWWLLLAGVWLVLWTGYLGAKALVLVHAAVWAVPAPPVRKAWLVSLCFTGTVLALGLSMAVAAPVHAGGGGLGLVAAGVTTAIPFGVWLVASRWLPHRGTSWTGLMPGALLVALGIQAFYVVTTWFLAPGIANATELYGLVGIVATALFWLYVLGRLAIGAATLNASVYEHGAPPAEAVPRSSEAGQVAPASDVT